MRLQAGLFRERRRKETEREIGGAMALYALGDLHLSFGTDRSMDRYGKAWVHHEEKIRKNWEMTVKEEDTIVLVGDFSQGRNERERQPDFDFLLSLPGRKIMLRGNHDTFWEVKKTRRLNEKYKGQLFFLQNNFASYKDYALVGTKGYCYENLDSFGHFQIIQERELERLQVSFEAAREAGYQKYLVFLHYPPTSAIWPFTEELIRALGFSRKEERLIKASLEAHIQKNGGVDIGRNPVLDLHALPPDKQRRAGEVTELFRSPFTDMAEKYGASALIYGHCHGKERFHDSLSGQVRGIRYQLTSGDYLDFKPYLVMD